MRPLRHEEARRTLLPDLPAGHEGALLHLLTCEGCRAEIATRLQGSLDDTRDEGPQPELLLDGGKPLLQEALRRGHEARRGSPPCRPCLRRSRSAGCRKTPARPSSC